MFSNFVHHFVQLMCHPVRPRGLNTGKNNEQGQKSAAVIAILLCVIFVLVIVLATWQSIQPLPEDLLAPLQVTGKNTYLDRYGRALNLTYDNEWNRDNRVALHEIPEFLQRAFIISEDRRFYSHGGVDWLARLNALKQNILAGEVVRGASTLTEQVVRMLHPRPRTVWSRWIEGFEAAALERRFSKIEILEFYLNQVPYKARRRGIVQAAHYYFDRDLSTLNQREMLALAVLVRSPRWLDPNSRANRLDRAIANLVQRLENHGLENHGLENHWQEDVGEAAIDRQRLARQPLTLQAADIEHDVSHFIRYADSRPSTYNRQTRPGQGVGIHTTIDLELQQKIQRMLDSRLDGLRSRGVKNGAVLVVDHQTNEVLSWVVGHAGKPNRAFNKIDAVTVGRQPGSTLKPFLYANAIRKGWTAATLLDDAPLEESVGAGMHRYHNYSRGHYGPISLREALGNSLNIPAVRAIQFVGPHEFLSLLSDFGIKSLTGHPNVYGDGLALGNGELTLLELVQAYTVLACMGDFKTLSFIDGEHLHKGSSRVLSEDIASLIADILSDPAAREKEFGWDSILNFPTQTAVKTGTSSDYRDAWALGFNHRYTVGVWMGNLDYSAMNQVTGASGPALILRGIFNELNRPSIKNRETRPLYFSSNLIKQRICIETGLLAQGDCEARDEWFVPGSTAQGLAGATAAIRIRKPSNGLRLAMDPRIPDESEYVEFALTEIPSLQEVHWYVNNRLLAVTPGPRYHWKLSRGEFTVRAQVYLNNRAGSGPNGIPTPVVTDEVAYKVN